MSLKINVLQSLFVQMYFWNVSSDEAFVCHQRWWCQRSRWNPPAKRVRTTLDTRRDSKLRSAKQDTQVRNPKGKYLTYLDYEVLREVPLWIVRQAWLEKAQEAKVPGRHALFSVIFKPRSTKMGPRFTLLVKFPTCNFWHFLSHFGQIEQCWRKFTDLN